MNSSSETKNFPLQVITERFDQNVSNYKHPGIIKNFNATTQFVDTYNDVIEGNIQVKIAQWTEQTAVLPHAQYEIYILNEIIDESFTSEKLCELAYPSQVLSCWSHF